MLLPPARPGLFTYALVFVLRFCSASQPVCSVGIYGIPNYKDCLSAWHSMPFALKPTSDYGSKRYELWSEPQYLLPPFTAIYNRYRPLPINQLPKIWRYNTCRLALLSYGRPTGSVVSSLWGGDWRTVLDQMQTLFVCGSPRIGAGPSGGYKPFISQKTGQVSAALYIYSAYSPFEDVLNHYMSKGLPITPITSMDQLDVVGNSSFASLINITREIRHMPVDFSLLRDITLLDH